MDRPKKGDKIECRNYKELISTAFKLSSLGYGVAVIGLSDIMCDMLTITEEPEEKETEQ